MGGRTSWRSLFSARSVRSCETSSEQRGARAVHPGARLSPRRGQLGRGGRALGGAPSAFRRMCASSANVNEKAADVQILAGEEQPHGARRRSRGSEREARVLCVRRPARCTKPHPLSAPPACRELSRQARDAKRARVRCLCWQGHHESTRDSPPLQRSTPAPSVQSDARAPNHRPRRAP